MRITPARSRARVALVVLLLGLGTACSPGGAATSGPTCTPFLDVRVNVNGLEHDTCAVRLAGVSAAVDYDATPPPAVDGGVDGTASNALDPLTCGVDPGAFFDVACPGQTASTPAMRCRRSSRCLWITADGDAAAALGQVLGGAESGAAVTVHCGATDAVTSAHVSLCAE